MEENQGLERPEEIDTSSMSEEVKGFVEQKVRESQNPTYEQMFRETLMREQKRTMQLAKKGLINSDNNIRRFVNNGKCTKFNETGIDGRSSSY